MLINSLPEFIREIAARRYLEQHGKPHDSSSTVVGFTWSQTPEATCDGGSPHVWAHVDIGKFDDFPGYKESLQSTLKSKDEVNIGDTLVYVREPSSANWVRIGEIPIPFSIGDELVVDKFGSTTQSVGFKSAGMGKVFPICCFKLKSKAPVPKPLPPHLDAVKLPCWLYYCPTGGSTGQYEYVTKIESNEYTYSHKMREGDILVDFGDRPQVYHGLKDLHILTLPQVHYLKDKRIYPSPTALKSYPLRPEEYPVSDSAGVGIISEQSIGSVALGSVPGWYNYRDTSLLEYVTERSLNMHTYRYSHYVDSSRILNSCTTSNRSTAGQSIQPVYKPEHINLLKELGVWPHPPSGEVATPKPAEERIPYFIKGDVVRCIRIPTIEDYTCVGIGYIGSPKVYVDDKYEVAEGYSDGRMCIMRSNGNEDPFWLPSMCFELHTSTMDRKDTDAEVVQETGLPKLRTKTKTSLCTDLPSMEPIKIKILSTKTPHI